MLPWGSLAAQDGQKLNGSLLVTKKQETLGRGVAFTFHSNPVGNYYYLQFTEEETEEQRTSETCGNGGTENFRNLSTSGWNPALNPHRIWLPSSHWELEI